MKKPDPVPQLDPPPPDRQSHIWLVAPDEDSRHRLAPQALNGCPPLLAVLDAHRRLRGPFTAAGTLMRLLVPQALESRPELVSAHDIEVLSAAPELRAVLPCARETLTSLTPAEKRTRFYPYIRTTRIAHGLTDFLLSFLGPPATLLVLHAEHADRTDSEWLAILLRRADPRRLRLLVCTAGPTVPPALASALGSYAARWTSTGTETADDAVKVPSDPADRQARAAVFVNADCATEDPVGEECYAQLPPATRARLHDVRAGELQAAVDAGETSLCRGALPFHLEHGSDPLTAGSRALREAMEHLLLEGFYDALLDMGPRTQALLDWTAAPEECWLVTVRMAIAYSVMGGHAEDVLALYDAACAATALPSVHMSAAYGRAMVFTRYMEPERRDHQKAKAWVNTAVALSQLSPTAERRAYNLTFNENGLALIETHLGNPERALGLVDAGIARLDAELDNADQGQHRSVLEYNRAQLVARLQGPDAGAAAYGRVIAQDPNHSEYYFERAALLRLAGRSEEALADYSEAIRTSPPYPEAVYNRADLRAELGDIEGALTDFDRVLELDPDFLDAYVNRAGLRHACGDISGTAQDVTAGLERDAEQPHLLCLRGLIAQHEDRSEDALSDLEAAVRLAPELACAWVGLGDLAFERGEFGASVRCFDQALLLEEDPTTRAHRALAHESMENWAAAADDYTAAIGLLPAEETEQVQWLRDKLSYSRRRGRHQLWRGGTGRV
ncbi:tetratricopeptide repeat protein [Streptomyces poonensis]|uniref:Tetratricopeptide repeat protein n=1 Tax=Streptomyces poonensis TaxID=68255 RepID=A0A918Q0Y8_9ACTN|nr:tetratricopeptide repeat protein [Streptomyces poonensis]GGZ29657.1 hypothetical protein GCM10010365_57530 [Streptomyces poonensis]